MLKASGSERRRLVAWDDPHTAAASGLTTAGLDFLRAVRDGSLPLPPIAHLFGFDVTEVEHGRVVMRLQPAEFHYNLIGSVHGGVAAMLLDSVMGCAVHSALPVGRQYTTLEIKINYLHALTAGSGELRAEGKTVHLGNRVATAEGRVTDPSGRLCATGTTTCLLVDVPLASDAT